MDLTGVTAIVRPQNRGGLPAPCAGDAFLAGGTWLFSEPQHEVRRLIDLQALGLASLEVTAAGLAIGATCTLGVLEAFTPPERLAPAWRAAWLIRRCCEALLGSFKIRHVVTVGGNLCLALPAAPMAALAVALQGQCVTWSPDGSGRTLHAIDLITGAGVNSLRHGEILQLVALPDAALRRRAAFRQVSLTPLGRSAALLIGTQGDGDFELTITAAVARPVWLRFDAMPTTDAMHAAIADAVPVWFDDVHGAPGWRRRVTHLAADDIRSELMGA